MSSFPAGHAEYKHKHDAGRDIAVPSLLASVGSNLACNSNYVKPLPRS